MSSPIMPSNVPRKAIIAIISATPTFYPDGTKTGLFYTEALHPYDAFVETGFDVCLASETGTFGYDEHSITKDFLDDDDMRAYKDPKHPFNVKLNSRLHKASSVDPSKYGLFFASAGHACIYDYPNARGFQSIAEDIYARGSFVSAVCHGPAILPGIKALDGHSVIEVKKVTGFTTEGEIQLHVIDKIKEDKVPTIEDGAAKVGAKYEAPPSPFADYGIIDGIIVTGANPASAKSTAKNGIRCSIVYDS
jgi:putative intracellular protease/amidase